MRTLGAAIGLVLLLAACDSSTPTPEPLTAAFGETVVMQSGQQGTFGTELDLTFVEVTEDRRCPGMNCEPRDGVAGILLKVRSGGVPHRGEEKGLLVSIMGDRSSVRAFDVVGGHVNGEPANVGYLYTYGLCPYPTESGEMLEQAEYRLYIRVDEHIGPVGEAPDYFMDIPCAP